MATVSAPDHPLTEAEEQALVAAIGAAEQGHRGEIRVHLEPRYPGDGPVARAAALFDALGMRKTAQDTGVLVYVAWRDQRAAVWAGAGVHDVAAPGLWQDTTDAVAAAGKAGRLAAGLCEVVAALGDTLRGLVPGADLSLIHI